MAQNRSVIAQAGVGVGLATEEHSELSEIPDTSYVLIEVTFTRVFTFFKSRQIKCVLLMIRASYLIKSIGLQKKSRSLQFTESEFQESPSILLIVEGRAAAGHPAQRLPGPMPHVRVSLLHEP